VTTRARQAVFWFWVVLALALAALEIAQLSVASCGRRQNDFSEADSEIQRNGGLRR